MKRPQPGSRMSEGQARKNTRRSIPNLRISLFGILFLGASTGWAQSACSHLGGPVACPPGIAPGSSSVNFIPGGILWSDGNTSLGTNLPPLVLTPIPPMPVPLIPGSPPRDSADQLSRSGFELNDTQEPGRARFGNFFPGPNGQEFPRAPDLLDPESSPGFDSDPTFDLGLRGTRAQLGSQLGPGFTFQPNPGAGPGTPPGSPPPLQSPDELLDTMVGGDSSNPREGIARVPKLIPNAPTLPSYFLGEAPPAGSREAIRDEFQGTGDIAGVAEALTREGAIQYDQSSSEQLFNEGEEYSRWTQFTADEYKLRSMRAFIGMAGPEDLLHSTRGNCYEFVHFAAHLAGLAEGPMQTSNGGVRSLIRLKTLRRWDGESEIPRGMIVVGNVSEYMGGQDDYGFFHVGISLGGGLVANNRGSGVQIEETGEVFNSFYTNPAWGEGIWYGEYAGYRTPENVADFLQLEAENLREQIRVSRENPEEAYEGMEISDEELEAGIENLEGRLAIIEGLQGNRRDGSDIDARRTPDGESYTEFVEQVLDAYTNRDRFFHRSYKTYPERTTSFELGLPLEGASSEGSAGDGAEASEGSPPRDPSEMSNEEFERAASQYFLDAYMEADLPRTEVPELPEFPDFPEIPPQLPPGGGFPQEPLVQP